MPNVSAGRLEVLLGFALLTPTYKSCGGINANGPLRGRC